MPLIRRCLSVAVAVSLAALAACDQDIVNDNPQVITLNPASITAVPGDTVHVRVVKSGRRVDTLSSTVVASSEVLRVGAGGLVTAVAPGTAVLTVTFTDGGQTVTGTIPATVLGITVEPAQSTIPIGATTFLRLTFAGSIQAYGGLRFSSSDSTVATVDAGGSVRGVRPGTARIAVVAVSDPRARAEAAITVLAPPPAVTLTVQPDVVALPWGSTQQLAVTVSLAPGTPSSVSRDVRFTSSDTTVATVSATGLVTGLRPGMASITVVPVAAPTISQTVSVLVRSLVSHVTIQSVTALDPPGAVDLDAVRGRIRVAINLRLDPGLETRRVELWLAGRLAAATDSVSRAADGLLATATLDVDTAARDATGARLYPDGAARLEVRVAFAQGGLPATQTETVLLPLMLANP